MTSIDATLKLPDERVREILAVICGTSVVHEADTGAARTITPPSLDELASITNELISARTALSIYEQAELAERSCA